MPTAERHDALRSAGEIVTRRLVTEAPEVKQLKQDVRVEEEKGARSKLVQRATGCREARAERTQNSSMSQAAQCTPKVTARADCDALPCHTVRHTLPLCAEKDLQIAQYKPRQIIVDDCGPQMRLHQRPRPLRRLDESGPIECCSAECVRIEPITPVLLGLLGNLSAATGAEQSMDDGRRRERGMDLKTRGEYTHTRGPSACHPLDRSATLLLTHGTRADFSISIAGLGLLQS